MTDQQTDSTSTVSTEQTAQPTAQPTQATGGTSASPDWRGAWSPEAKSMKSVAAFQNSEELAKSYDHLVRKLGAPKVDIPGKDAGADDWKRVKEALGLPKDPAKYEIQMDQSVKADKEALEAFKKAAWEAGVLPKDAQAMVNWVYKEAAAKEKVIQSQQAQRQEQWMNTIKQEFGKAYEEKTKLAHGALKELAGEKFEELAGELESSGLANHPTLVKIFSQIGELMKEDTIKGGSDFATGRTPNDIQAEIDKVMHDKTAPYWNKKHPAYETEWKRVAALFEQLK